MSSKDSFFPLPKISELPSQLQAFFSKAAEQLGFVPNAFLSYAWRPERFSAWFNHYRLLTEPTDSLTAVDREMIAVVVSSINSCTYCHVSHSHALRVEAEDPVLAGRIAVNWRHAGLDARQQAICEYVEKLTKTPALVGVGDLEPLKAAGLSETDIWDVIELAAMYSFTNRISIAMGTLPNEEYHLENH